MTAENKISPRQLRRMLFIEMFGAGRCPFLPLPVIMDSPAVWRCFFMGFF